MTTAARRWTVWAPAAVSVVGGLVAMLAWVFNLAADVERNTERVVALERLTAMAERVAVLEQRVATVEREQGAASDALWRRMLERNVPPGLRP